MMMQHIQIITRITSDKILKNRAYEIIMSSKYDGYERGLVSIRL